MYLSLITDWNLLIDESPFRSSVGGISEPAPKSIGWPKGGTGDTTTSYPGGNSVSKYNATGNKTYFEKGYSKFERSDKDVMARASQIVQ